MPPTVVHKGGQINNVQLITGLRIAEMSQQQQNCNRGGGGGSAGVREDVKELIEFLWKKKFFYQESIYEILRL